MGHDLLPRPPEGKHSCCPGEQISRPKIREAAIETTLVLMLAFQSKDTNPL